jgi:hypothetical protein
MSTPKTPKRHGPLKCISSSSGAMEGLEEETVNRVLSMLIGRLGRPDFDRSCSALIQCCHPDARMSFINSIKCSGCTGEGSKSTARKTAALPH